MIKNFLCPFKIWFPPSLKLRTGEQADLFLVFTPMLRVNVASHHLIRKPYLKVKRQKNGG